MSKGSGKWQDHAVATSYGTLMKVSSNVETTLKMEPIGKKFTWNINNTDKGIGNGQSYSYLVFIITAFLPDCRGTFLCYSVPKLKNNTTVKAAYDADRVIFTDDQNSMVGAVRVKLITSFRLF